MTIMELLGTVLDCTLALIALINPVSKIFVISTLSEKISNSEIRGIAVKSSFIAAGILLSFLFIGNFLLSTIFHVQIHSFKIAGGLVLLYNGFQALTRGLFFEVDYN